MGFQGWFFIHSICRKPKLIKGGGFMKIQFIFMIILITFYGCATSITKKSVMINPGQSKAEVLEIFGTPENRQFQGKDEAWQYCQTGWGTDEYVVIWFYDGKVTGITTYKSSAPTIDCTENFKTIKWEDAPDHTIEIREK